MQLTQNNIYNWCLFLKRILPDDEFKERLNKFIKHKQQYLIRYGIDLNEGTYNIIMKKY